MKKENPAFGNHALKREQEIIIKILWRPRISCVYEINKALQGHCLFLFEN